MESKRFAALRPFGGVLAALVAGALLLGAVSAAHAGDRKKMSGKIDGPVLYHNYCSVCHGDSGDGNSRAKNSLVPAPANFTDEKLQGKLTTAYIAAIVREGKPKTAMVGWKSQLNEAEIQAVSEYVRHAFVELSSDKVLQRGRSLYGHYCVTCHGITGDGKATAGASLVPPPRDLTAAAARKELNRERILLAVAMGRKGTAMQGFAGQLSPQDIEAVSDYVEKWILTGQSTAAISGVSAHTGRESEPGRQPQPARR